MSRRFALLVNPASAGGKALKALPVVHETLDRLGAPHRTVTTRSTEHAAENAKAGDLRLTAAELARIDEAFPRGPRPRVLPVI